MCHQISTTHTLYFIKVIVEHQNRWLSRRDNRFNLKLFSNDNGFLSYNPHFFTQRTLLARFQMNNTKPAHVQFIRKPIYSVMGLLSYLGETQLKANLGKVFFFLLRFFLICYIFLNICCISLGLVIFKVCPSDISARAAPLFMHCHIKLVLKWHIYTLILFPYGLASSSYTVIQLTQHIFTLWNLYQLTLKFAFQINFPLNSWYLVKEDLPSLNYHLNSCF